MAENNNEFNYSYKALDERQRREIESIKYQYVDKKYEPSNIDRLKKLDNKVKNTAFIPSLSLGIVGLLVFGLGITCVLEWDLIILGVILGICGAVLMLIAYPVYSFILNKMKLKYKDEILKISDELLETE